MSSGTNEGKKQAYHWNTFDGGPWNSPLYPPAHVRTVPAYGSMSYTCPRQESVYPKGASVQFYKLFLDPAVRSQVSAYGALALIEWDVLVAHDRSFEMLYRSAFGSVEPFWIKGSILEGTNFHDTVIGLEQRHILGHINGNAIYNNTDPGFVDFIEYTLARWKFDYSYDVALWASVADFPYSWPLWQRFSRKFVTTNLVRMAEASPC